jgi:hypothetical protein
MPEYTVLNGSTNVGETLLALVSSEGNWLVLPLHPNPTSPSPPNTQLPTIFGTIRLGSSLNLQNLNTKTNACSVRAKNLNFEKSRSSLCAARYAGDLWQTAFCSACGAAA